MVDINCMKIHFHLSWFSLSRFNPTSAGTSVAVPSISIFASVFYIGGYAGDIAKLLSQMWD
jgi:hypothetical protein